MPNTLSSPGVSSSTKPAKGALNRSPTVPKNSDPAVRSYQTTSTRNSHPSHSLSRRLSAAYPERQPDEEEFASSPEPLNISASASSNGRLVWDDCPSPLAISLESRREDDESWDLRTETAGAEDQASDLNAPANALHTTCTRQITHYKNLLVRAQSSSAASLHELHTKLHDLEVRHAKLEVEHLISSEERQTRRRTSQIDADTVRSLTGEMKLEETIRALNKVERMDLLGRIAAICHPSDVTAQIAILEHCHECRFDILERLDRSLSIKILTYLDVPDILTLRTVSSRHQTLTHEQAVWKTKCLQLERENDPVGCAKGVLKPDPCDWQSLFKGLWQRNRNWRKGLAQSVTMSNGHTKYVTSLVLSGDTLVSASYDQTIRIWQIPRSLYSGSTVTSECARIPAKAVSCLAYYEPEQVIVAGAHDVGRVQIWRKENEQWNLQHTLAGHLNGIRAVAINHKWLVSAGADKSLVVWDWRTGERVVKWGQQSNLCVNIRLSNSTLISVTVDGIIRAFSITKRELISQYRIQDLSATVNERQAMKISTTGAPGTSAITWLAGEGRHLTCATRELIFKMEWEKIEISGRPAVKAAISIDSASARTLKAASLAPSLVSSSRGEIIPHTPTQAKSPSLKLRSASATAVALLTSAPSNHISPSPSSVSQTPTKTISDKPERPLGDSTHSEQPSAAEVNDAMKSTKQTETWIELDFSRPPRLTEIIRISDAERGAMDPVRGRIVATKRFTARAGADRQLYVGNCLDGSTRICPIKGAWTAKALELGLQTPEKKPMSLVVDQEKLIYGCSDGNIVVVGFVGSTY